MTLALTQAARGEQALEALSITVFSKDEGFYAMISATFFLSFGVTFLASKLMI